MLLAVACSGSAAPPVVHVYAASSLQPVLEGMLLDFERAHPTITVRAEYDESQTLAAQVMAGGHADVFLSADAAPVQLLASAAHVQRSAPLVQNRLVVAVRRVSLLEDVTGLAQPGVRIAVGAPGTPLATLTNAALVRLSPKLAQGLRANIVLQDPDATVLMSHVDLGEADAAFVYRTDLAKWPDERAIDLPPQAALTANRYVIAELAGAVPGSSALFDYLTGPRALQAFEAGGFEPVTPPAATGGTLIPSAVATATAAATATATP